MENTNTGNMKEASDTEENPSKGKGFMETESQAEIQSEPLVDSKTVTAGKESEDIRAGTTKAKEDLRYLYINGNVKRLVALNPKFDKDGKLEALDGLVPFPNVDKDGNPITPTVDDANSIKRKHYNEFFQKPFKNLLILSGAGSSVEVGLPLMKTLWERAKSDIGESRFEKLCKEVNHSKKGDFEGLISRIDGFIIYNSDKDIDGEKLTAIRDKILKRIRKDTNVQKPKTKFPHVTLLQKLLQRKQTNSRVKVFTLNYDLLFEMAANEINAVVIDGFSFTSPRTFGGRFFDYDVVQREGSKVNEEDNFISRVFHLYKLHGSLNWEKVDSTGNIIIKEDSANPLMVYPREGKYKDSYAQPFFEMMARFQRNLRQDNDTLLLCIGYSFNDNHINAAIEEAINQNPGFRMAVIDPFFSYTETTAYKNVVSEALNSERIMLVSEAFSDFANNYPEIKTYNNEDFSRSINLRNDGQ